MTYPENADLETPVEDAAEQAASAVPNRQEDDDGDLQVDLETPEWDAQEQARTVEIDDEYR
jgi:hypothetical protein